MRLTLRILSYRNQPVPPAPTVSFGMEGGSIGRSAGNALVLDDPSKYISRVHARVTAQDGAFVLEDLGSNASVVNDRPLGKGQQVALAHGDRVLIGDYLLQAVVDSTPVAAVAPPPANNPSLPVFEPPPPAPPVELPPFEDVPTQPAPARPPQPAPAFLDPLANASILDVGPGQRNGNTDPLGLNLLSPAAGTPLRAAESDHISPEWQAMPPARPMPMMDLKIGSAAAPERRPAPNGFEIPADYDLLGDSSAPPALATSAAATLPAVAPSAVGASTAFAPAVIAEPKLAPQPATLPRQPVPGNGTDGEVLAALLRGLGLPDLQLHRSPADTAEIVGAMLREATAGTIDVLMARALTKRESRIDMTMLSVHANNPLKFFPNADGALIQMLTGAMSGYMEPVEAMASAFDDLRAHELAVIAGMRAALGAVLERFDPARIEARLAVPTVLDKMLSSGRKAKLWDRLVELYGEIAREADDDLQRVYGEKFSEAYEEQVARLRRAKQ